MSSRRHRWCQGPSLDAILPQTPTDTIFGLAPKWSMIGAMTYIVERKNRFYVVAYDGLDPLTGKERRRWHPDRP